MFVQKKQTSTSMLLIIINLALMFVVVVLAKSDHDHDHPDHHHHDHQHNGHKLNEARKIYNGRRASRDAAKFMAAILLPRVVEGTPTERFLCTAVIITHDQLLTAAHCVYPVVRSMEILPGASNIDSAYHRTHRDLIRIIQAFWIHPEYETEHHTFDLAIIKIGPTPWQLGDDRLGVAQMPLRVKRERPPLKAYGYGSGEEGSGMVGGGGGTGQLNAIEYKRIYTQAYCELMVGLRFNGRDIFFATKERSHHHQLHISAGQEDGDSGGGVFVHGTVERFDIAANRWIPVTTKILVGIHSHRRVRQETMRPRTYFFHTNITTFLPWIQRYSDARFETYPFPQSLH